MQATTKITIHNGSNVHPFIVGTEFGTFELEIDKIEMTTKAQEINIVIDQSGSMDEMCEDGNSKMYQIKHVTNNILRFVSEKCKDINVKVGLHSFNTRVTTMFQCTNITEINLDALTFLLRHIRAEDGTNIEEPLKMLASEGKSVCPCVDINNILMSDGDANEGNTDPDALANMVDTSASNYFIGFGLDHNPLLFSALSDRENSNYYFIDKIEKSGIAYGEILQSILYRAYNGVRIKIENGMLYDWKTNEWRTELFVGKMSGEMKRTFHILTTAKEMVRITVTAQKIKTCEEILLNASWNEDADLTKLFYRQRTQEILYRVKKFNEEKIVNRDAMKAMKTEMKKFTAEMVEYMKKNGLSDDRLMKNLCDDIVVVYRTIGTQWGHMYSCSRQVSQGTERSHNTSDTPTSPRERLTPHNTRSWNLPDVFNVGNRRWGVPTSRNCSVMPTEEEEDELMNNHEMSELHYTETQLEVIESIVSPN